MMLNLCLTVYMQDVGGAKVETLTTKTSWPNEAAGVPGQFIKYLLI